MRWFPIALCAVSVLAALAAAVPVPEARPETLQDMQAQLPLEVQERLSALQLDEQQLEQVTRDKRTIAVLRQLFPGVGQLIDRKIQQITQYLFRTIGRLVLRGGLGGGGNAAAGGGAGTNNRRISITLPTFPPDSDEDEDEEEDGGATDNATEAGTTEPSPSELNPEENQLAGAESQVNEVRADENGYAVDQDAAASGGNDAPDPAIAIEDENADDADRNKRQFSFGASGGSGGGSGNFLFDIIRRTADRAARAAGTIYRVVAGTENLGLGVGVSASQTTTTTRTNQTSVMTTNNGTRVVMISPKSTKLEDETELVTGGSSGGGAASEASTDGTGASGAEKEDGYGAGIPGPVTRLFVIANRGIANLIQDLILRIAQTSERLVNFKARLITSII